MSEILYFNTEEAVGVYLKTELVDKIYQLCEEAYPNETGGILIGQYNLNFEHANVTMITGAPSDSKAGKTWFYRGTTGLQELLDELWDTQGSYYLGEWHYHPDGASSPSIQDLIEMKAISMNEKYNCPEPLLLIVGGSSTHQTFNCSMYIYLRNKNRLFPVLKSD
ncbi:Mov34/MPN/PAD-1 family protein [Bacillus cereus]|uniref:Mov34/MPN/PAD-1 family protein n=1 Tax=Bacillus cereus TaxID=1396 RepID=UPI003B7D2195